MRKFSVQLNCVSVFTFVFLSCFSIRSLCPFSNCTRKIKTVFIVQLNSVNKRVIFVNILHKKHKIYSGKNEEEKLTFHQNHILLHQNRINALLLHILSNRATCFRIFTAHCTKTPLNWCVHVLPSNSIFYLILSFHFYIQNALFLMFQCISIHICFVFISFFVIFFFTHSTLLNTRQKI